MESLYILQIIIFICFFLILILWFIKKNSTRERGLGQNPPKDLFQKKGHIQKKDI